MSLLPLLPHLARLPRIGFVFAREGVFGLIDPAGAPAPVRLLARVSRWVERDRSRASGVRLAMALQRMGPTYIKLGQFLATRADVVGAQVARDLSSLQDRMPAFPQAEAEAAVTASLGVPLATAYASFGPAIAAASVAQVHQAVRASDGSAVAVKVLRPGVDRRFHRDLNAFFAIATFAERWSAEARRLRLREVVATLARSVAIEMDLRLEAAALSEMGENTRDDPDFRVPQVDWELTARDVLTMEWIDGTPLSDRAGLAARGLDLPKLGRTVMQSFLRHALRDGFFHADMHPGNLFVDRDGRLTAVDFGIMGRLTPKERRFLAEILYGFITRNYVRTAEVHFEAGYVPPEQSVADFAQAIRAIGEPIHNRKASDISMAKLLTLLFEVTGLFNMRTRPELLLLQKTMVVVEGVARSMDPDLDMWATSEPVVREWMERHLGPAGRLEDAASGLASLGGTISEAPRLLARGAAVLEQVDLITRNGLLLAPETVRAIGRAEGRGNRAMTWALWIIAALLAALVLT